jgi:hypothetical protein
MPIRRFLFLLLIVCLLAGAGFMVWQYFSPSDERRIAALLEECADAVAFGRGEAPAGALLKLRAIESRIEDELTIRWRRRGAVQEQRLDRRAVMGHLASSRKYLSDLRIDVSDLNITVDGDSAFAESSIQLSGHATDGRWDDPILEEVSFELVRRDGVWRVAAVNTRDFMEK